METQQGNPQAAATPGYTLWDLVAYALKLGSIGFGGPAALVAYMHRDLVEKRRWITELDYKEGMALSQLMPGPLATQLMMYFGFVHYRVLGATLAGVAFVVPSFFMVVALGWLYVRFGGLSWMQAVFYGVGACVIGIIAMSAYKLTTKNIGNQRLLWAIYVVSALITAITESESVWVFLIAGILVMLIRSPPKHWPWSGAANAIAAIGVNSVPAAAANSAVLSQIAWFFAKAGAVVFGSGLAIVPFLYGGVVNEYHWLNERQFVDAVAVAMITPGPVVITVAFIGYLVASFPGACIAALATFLPCYFFTIIPAPYFNKYGKRPAIIAFVDGATAAAIGTISGAVFVLGKRSIVDIPTALIALATVLALVKLKKLPEPVIVLIAAVIGLIVYPLLAPAH